MESDNGTAETVGIFASHSLCCITLNNNQPLKLPGWKANQLIERVSCIPYLLRKNLEHKLLLYESRREDPSTLSLINNIQTDLLHPLLGMTHGDPLSNILNLQLLLKAAH